VWSVDNRKRREVSKLGGCGAGRIAPRCAVCDAPFEQLVVLALHARGANFTVPRDAALAEVGEHISVAARRRRIAGAGVPIGAVRAAPLERLELVAPRGAVARRLIPLALRLLAQPLQHLNLPAFGRGAARVLAK
jgi:hypothetical protein